MQETIIVNRFPHSLRWLLFLIFVGVLFAQVISPVAQGRAQDSDASKKIGRPLPDLSSRIAQNRLSSALYVAGDLFKDRILLVGERGLILQSKDRGQSFAQVSSPTRRLLSDVLLRSDGVAFAVGHESTILRSKDADATWEAVHHDPEQDLALFSIADAGAGKLVAVGAFGLILTSSDDGLTWEQGLVSEDGPHLYSVKSHKEGLVTVGEFGSLYSSSDQGKSWKQLPTPYEGTLFDILIMKDRWILMGLRGNLWEGNVSRWKKISVPTDATLFGGALLTDDTVIVVGAEGVSLLRSPTSGEWTSLEVREADRRLLSEPLPLLDDSVLGLGEKGYRFILGHGGSPLKAGEQR